jgi:hypothetical protein
VRNWNVYLIKFLEFLSVCTAGSLSSFQLVRTAYEIAYSIWTRKGRYSHKVWSQMLTVAVTLCVAEQEGYRVVARCHSSRA